MSGATAFLITLALALVVWLVFHRFGTPATRAFLDRQGEKAFGQDRVAQIGETALPRDAFGQLVMPLTIGVRMIGTVLGAALLYTLNMHSENGAISPIPPEYFWEGYTIASLLMAWYMGYIWTYSLMLDGNRLIVPTWGFGSREYDLRQLIRVDDDNAFMLRLYFDEGGKAEIFKNVRGRAELMAALDARLA